MADLVTGARGQAHITPKNDAVIHRGMMGVESCILDYGEKLAPMLVPSQPTNIRILDGCGMMQGRFFEIEEGSYDTITIPNGAQGYNRIDLVCAKITQNENGTQTFSWEVVQGTQTEGTPTPPTVAEGSLDDGDEFALMPIASVELEGVNIVAVETVAEIGGKISDAYIKAGDVIATVYLGASYLTTDKTQISITIPFNKVIVADSVVVTSCRLITRQNTRYTHGSSAGTRIDWNVASASITACGVQLVLTHSTDSSAVNNDAIGIDLAATFTFV